ncbi:unnamed protein product [Linum trigynum]|uniref:Zinc finger GRF-type domain-containing protein n=1 Tax=Linum trigynum TaxID=586398 RepID=A0AAV2CVT3_9ROSI
MATPFCRCGLASDLKTSWIEANPGRRFYECSKSPFESNPLLCFNSIPCFPPFPLASSITNHGSSLRSQQLQSHIPTDLTKIGTSLSQLILMGGAGSSTLDSVFSFCSHNTSPPQAAKT